MDLQVPEPVKKVLDVGDLFDSNDVMYPVAEFFYSKVKVLYKRIGKRKNGENSLLHPLNVVMNLKRRGGVADQVTLLGGLLHDYIEEQVDMYAKDEGIDHKSEKGKRILDSYEVVFSKEFQADLLNLKKKYGISRDFVSELVGVLSLLTRHKRHFYYKSLSFMFTSIDYSDRVREMAMQIKMADRIHNIQSIECFSERGRLYQCFKNFFILNNVKRFLLDHYDKSVFHRIRDGKKPVETERLFNKCAKATYLAYLKICVIATNKGIWPVKTALQLAFKKYKFEYSGIWEVTDVVNIFRHPMHLYFGIVRKFDARLHQEREAYEERILIEKAFCERYFAVLKYKDDQLRAILDYKDAYALKEIIAHLLYDHNYYLKNFIAEDLTRSGRIRKRKR